MLSYRIKARSTRKQKERPVLHHQKTTHPLSGNHFLVNRAQRVASAEKRLQTTLAEEVSALGLVRTSHRKETDGALVTLLDVINQLGFVATS